MRRRLLLPLAAAAALALAAGPASAAITGTILVGKGVKTADGTLVSPGLTRAQVVAALGKPAFENRGAFMEYSGAYGFDLYMDGSRVDLVSVIAGDRFCTPSGICLYRKGGLGKLKAKFGAALKRRDLQDGTHWTIRSRVNGEARFTDFMADGTRDAARLTLVDIGAG